MENVETIADPLSRISELEADLSQRTEAWRASLRLLSEAEERCTRLSAEIDNLRQATITGHENAAALTSDDWDDILHRSRTNTAG